jgi:serine/threonine-protein kinase ULK/ATG1
MAMYKVGSYEIYDNDILGKGSFSIVYKAKYVGPSRPRVKYGKLVAVKIIITNRLNSNALRIVDDEIDMMNMIKEDPHPNIVECYDVIRAKDKIYIFMEYCDSGDLREIIKKPIKEKYTQFYFSQLANGLKYLDQHAIIHRDIKPRNILLTNKRQVLKIADFGFAKQTKEISLYDTICGSPMYMAPEVLNKGNEKYDGKTDLWSIGMILYEMLYGVHPYQGCKTIPELRERNRLDVQIQIPPVTTTNTNVSDECISLLKKLLQKSAANRITWAEFFNHPWLNLYQYIIPTTNKKNEEYEKQICAVSIGSLNRDEIPKTDIPFQIIDNYCDKYTLNNKLDKSESQKEPTNDSDDDDKCMFPMDEDKPKNTTITVKSVVDNGSILDDVDDQSHHYEIIDIE